MFTPVIIYGIFCVFWAYVNAQTIKEGGGILHWANMILHATTCFYFGISVHWILGLAMFFEARPLFDTALSLFRGLPIDYVSPKPASVTDRIEKAVFKKDGLTPKIIYTVLFGICLFLWRTAAP